MKRWWWLPALVLLASCAPLPERPAGRWTAPEWSTWSLAGRLALRAGERGGTANLYWRQEGAAYFIRLNGPFGQGGVEISGGPTGVVLRQAGGGEYRAGDPETLLLQATGWRLPLSGLRYWIFGRPEPGLAVELQRDEAGRPTRLDQAGWTIRFEKYRSFGGAELPARIRLERADVRLKLVIDRWQQTS